MGSINVFKIDAKLILPNGALPPDSFRFESKVLPSNDFVVSRNREGDIISVYGDDIWDFTVYQPEGKPSNLQFIYWDTGSFTLQRRKLLDEIKHVFFILIWLRDKNPLSIGTLRNYLGVVRVAANFAEYREISLKALISDEIYFLEFVRSQNSGWLIETFSSLLLLLAGSSHKKLAVEIVNQDTINLLRKHNKEYRSNLKQHTPIPTQIYSEILSGLVNFLDEWQQFSDEILILISECYGIKKEGEHRNTITFKKVLDKSSVGLQNYVFKRIGKFTVKGIVSLITDTQALCKVAIQSFTGMREEEAQSLLYFCINRITSNYQNYILINGRTTKFSHGVATPVQWVTNDIGLKAVNIAQEIADSIYQLHNDRPCENKKQDYPLFISTSYLGFTGNLIQKTSTKYRIGSLYSKQGLDSLMPKIEASDIRELEQIDPHRAWRLEKKFQVGSQWAFTSHQLRRSLALYAQRSGLVSLPSLRRQLQHITSVMTSYYARGSVFAKNLIEMDKNHFANEWQQTQLESASLGYIFNVLMSDEILHGGHVHWMENTLKDKAGNILVDRETTLKRFRNGEIAYQETILGGCTSLDPCSYSATNWLKINCLKDNCRHLVVSLPKLEKVIGAQENMMQFLDSESLEYRTELSNLEVLKDTWEKIIEIKEKKNV